MFPKAENKPVTLKDLNIKSQNEYITVPLIIDGSIAYANLKHIGKDENWILMELKKQGYQNYQEEVALAELDASWNLIILKK